MSTLSSHLLPLSPYDLLHLYLWQKLTWDFLDSALEHYGGTPDAGFLAFWEDGMHHGLPLAERFKWNDTPANRAVLKLYLDVVSLLESKAPGFGQLPAI